MHIILELIHTTVCTDTFSLCKPYIIYKDIQKMNLEVGMATTNSKYRNKTVIMKDTASHTEVAYTEI